MPTNLTAALIGDLNNLPGFPPASEFTLGDFLSQTVAGPNIVRVTQASDFPDAVAGIRTLMSDTIYFINGTVNLGTDVLQLPPSGLASLRGLSMSLDKVVTNNASALLSSNATPASLSIRDVGFVNSGGPVIDFDGQGSELFALAFAFFAGSSKAGTISNASQIMMFTPHVVGNADGFTISGNNGNCVMLAPIFVGNTGSCTCVEIPNGATLESFSIADGNLNVGAGQTGLDIDVAVLPTLGGFIRGTFFTGAGTYVTGIDKTVPGWRFLSNKGVLDSKSIATLGMVNNATVTTITVTNQFEPVAGAQILVSAERFSEPSNGVLQYDGLEDSQTAVTIAGSCQTAAGTDTYQIILYRNGSPVLETIAPFTATTSPSAFVSSRAIVVEPGDQLQVYIANTSGTNNFVVPHLALTVYGG